MKCLVVGLQDRGSSDGPGPSRSSGTIPSTRPIPPFETSNSATGHLFLLLALPIEIRNLIYRNVVHEATVKNVAPGTEFRLSTYGALLACCRQVRTEFFPLFLEAARIDFSSKIDKTTAIVRVPGLQLSAVQHARLDGHAFGGAGGMNLLKAMPNLKSLIYTVGGYGVYFLENTTYEKRQAASIPGP
ncbi:uncharacterized protein AB675_6083 [Cyphellophora attinorum]|uniref:Uncharacterized protein n=1 Tax=Cyphellophora attinorum TaxID=1664694 RepID=A0A0N1NXF3_9EURO|nr:uncharacterized protein AB675_6083 [Phialophora attinorum]KPI36915.1 hypothetical protein AB675_6083 [Phialophora attinorum]